MDEVRVEIRSVLTLLIVASADQGDLGDTPFLVFTYCLRMGT